MASMTLADFMLHLAQLEQISDKLAANLSDLERAAATARENRTPLDNVHATLLAETRAMHTLSVRAIVRAREAMRK